MIVFKRLNELFSLEFLLVFAQPAIEDKRVKHVLICNMDFFLSLPGRALTIGTTVVLPIRYYFIINTAKDPLALFAFLGII